MGARLLFSAERVHNYQEVYSTSGSLSTLQYLTPFLNLLVNDTCIKKLNFNRPIFKTRSIFLRKTHFLHLSQLYMLSPRSSIKSEVTS